MPTTPTEWTFWFLTAVVLAFFMSLAATYVKPWLDSRLGRVSDFFRARSDKARARSERAVERALSAPAELQDLWAEALYFSVAGWGMLVSSGIFMLAIGGISEWGTRPATDNPVVRALIVAFPFVVDVMALSMMTRALSAFRIWGEARRRRRKQEEGPADFDVEAREG